MLFLLLCAFGGGLYWRLGNGPLDAPMLVDRTLAAIAEKLPPGYGAELGNVQFERRDGRLSVILDHLALHGSDGKALVTAPRVVVGLSGASLLMGDPVAQAITVEGASATMIIGADGRIRFQAAALAPTGEAASFAEMMRAFDTLLAATSSIDAVEVRGATLVVHDEALRRDATYAGIDFNVRRTSAPGGLAVTLAVGGGTANATLERREDGARLIDVQARRIDIQAMPMVANGQPGLLTTLEATGHARIDPNGVIDLARLDVTSPGGSWQVEPDVKPFLFDEAGLVLRWDGPAHAIAVEQARVRAGEGGAVFSGTIEPPPEGPQGIWKIDLSAPGATVAGEAGDEAPLKLDVAVIHARYDPSIRRLGIDHGEFSGPTAGVAFAGSMTFGTKTPGIGLGLAAHRMSVAAVKRMWPFFSNPKLRAWFLQHAQGGTLESGTLTLAIPNDALVPVNGRIAPLPDESVNGEMLFSDASLKLHDQLPPLSNGEAQVTFSGRHAELVATSASVDMGETGTLALSDIDYVIADTAQIPPLQEISLRLKGPSAAVGALAASPLLSRAATGVAVGTAKVSGTADLRVEVKLPLTEHPRDEDVHYTINGSLESMTIDDFEGSRLEHGSLKIAAEPGLLMLTGKASFGGVPATVDFRKAADSQPQVAVGVTMDDAARKKRGLDFGDALNGPVSAEIHPQSTEDGQQYVVDIDLSAARIKDLLPGWQKPAGRSAKLSFVWDDDKDGGTIQNLTLDAGPVSLRGDISLGADHKLKKVALTTLRLSPGDDAQATVEASAGGWKATIKGRSFDLRPALTLLQRRGAGGGNLTAGSLAAQIQLDHATGFHDEVLQGLDLTLDLRSSTVRRLDLQGQFDSGAFAAKLESDINGNPVITISSPDAGAVMRFLNYYSRLHGGDLTGSITPTLDNMAGQLVMRNFSVVDEPALGQYRTTLQNSPSSKNLPEAPQNGNSASFTKLRLTFSRSADKLGISEAVIWGPDVGVSLAGDIDYGADKVNLVGTFVPAYALNNLFTQIPLFGDLLGGRYGGLFAITFKVSGRASGPILTVNPLSAIAPGFLRKIFEFQKE